MTAECTLAREYLHEMTVFPNGKHDDQVDSTELLITEAMDEWKVPGLAVAVVQNGRWRSERQLPLGGNIKTFALQTVRDFVRRLSSSCPPSK